MLFSSEALNKASYVILNQRNLNEVMKEWNTVHIYWVFIREVLDFSKLRKIMCFILR